VSMMGPCCCLAALTQVPSCRLTSGKLLMDAAAAAACPGTMAVKQLPCAKVCGRSAEPAHDARM
jgi:hypothetical protein